jgi:hypothetical protein
MLLLCVAVFQPEHNAFKELLAAPQEEAKTIARRRFPVPKIVDCDQNGSQVRTCGLTIKDILI